jgi:hypothetical protein
MNATGRWFAAMLAATCLGTVLVLVPGTGAIAAPSDAEVEALQMPAWLTHDGKRQPLALGAQLKNGDIITTGEGSRVLLRLGEGSVVKLGENARFDLNDMSQTRDHKQERFSATLGVRQGAFRLTTPPGVKSRGARSIDVRFPSLTASIGGTDIWGKAADDGEVVALIEGKINLTRKGDAPVIMAEAKTVYVAPADGPPRPVTAITLAQLNAYAQETELQPGSGGIGKVGNYKIYAARTPNQEEALAIYERLRDAGYAAAIQPGISGGKQVYQVRIVGFLTEADGVAVAVKLRVQLGLQDVRVSL